MCIVHPDAHTTTPPVPRCPAQRLRPPQRQQLALQALAGTQPISHLATTHEVSRKFVYQQTAHAQQALDQALDPDPGAEGVLFHLPVTKPWLRQLVLGLVLICHSSYRGAAELLGDLFDDPLAVGTLHHIVPSAIPSARARNDGQNLSGVRIGVPGEIFQGGERQQPAAQLLLDE